MNKLITQFTTMLIAIFVGILLRFPLLQAQPMAAGKSKFVGNVIRNGLLIRSDFGLFWNQVTPENAGKWGMVEGVKDGYNWAQLDSIYNYAKRNNFPYKHHTLVWGQQYPTWITTLDSVNQRVQVEEWIRLVGTRYPQMDFVEVVNEPFNAPPPYKSALGGDGKTGWDWVITAFQWARQYCSPTTKLLINEYNILHNTTRTNQYIALIETLKVRNLIDGIGVQGHYFEFKGTNYTYDLNTIKSNLNRLTALGLPFYITEFDVDEAVDSIQLQNYQTYFPIFWEHPGVRGITLWGYVYGETWKPNAHLLNSMNRPRPAFTWLIRYVKSPLPPQLVSPVNETNVPLNPILQWRKAETATSHKLQLATQSTFSSGSIVLDTTIVDTVLQVRSLRGQTQYYWRVSGSNSSGSSSYSSSSFTTVSEPTSVNENHQIPAVLSLHPNYPNPFNPTTIITYSVDKECYVSLKVYNTLGQEVATLFEGVRTPGHYSVHFNGGNLTSGIYYYSLKVLDHAVGIKAKHTITRKMLLLQ
ncbi:MAG: endo-1,4-beta-xylanase [Bacteroidetes bacterium]|nr:endo-1,4-beta-xylanase [Bacteroidota bacterium]